MFQAKSRASAKTPTIMRDGVIGARRVSGERNVKVLEKSLEPFAFATLLAWDTPEGWNVHARSRLGCGSLLRAIRSH